MKLKLENHSPVFTLVWYHLVVALLHLNNAGVLPRFRWLRFAYTPDETASLMIGAYKGNAQWIGAMKDWKGAKVESGTWG